MTTKKLAAGPLVLMILPLFFSCATGAGLGEPVSSDWPDLRVRRDNFQNAYFVHSAALNRELVFNPIFLYVVKTETSTVLRFRTVYTGDWWLFFNRVILANEQGVNFQFDFESAHINRVVVGRGGGIRETADIAVSGFVRDRHSQPDRVRQLRELFDGTNVRVRLTGGGRTQDYNIFQSNVAALRDMIAYFESITSTIE